jgi:two-component system, NtrC family, sensor kinase
MTSSGDIKMTYERIDELNSDAWNIRVKDSTKAMSLSRQVVDLATNINYTKGLAQGLRTLGFCYIRISEHKQALTYLDKSYDLFLSLSDQRGQAEIMGYYGIIQRSFGNLEASLDLFLKSLEIVQTIGYKEGESLDLYHIGVCYRYLGDYEQALNYFLKSLDIARSIDDWISESYSLNNIGIVYFETGDYNNALEYYHQSLNMRCKSGDKWGESGCLDKIGNCRQAVDFCSQSLAISEEIKDQKGQGNALFHLGNIYEKLEQIDQALDCYSRALQIRQKIGDKIGEAEILMTMAHLFTKENFNNNSDQKVFELLNKALELGKESKALDLLTKIHHGFYEAYKKTEHYEDSLCHLESSMSIEKEIHNAAINQKIRNLEISNRIEKSKSELEIYRLRNIELASLFEQTNNQKVEIEIQKKKVEVAFQELKSTQAQLIQSEKMSSLGELTAGVAHEIQNPLNFVNNFSEINKELIADMKQELAAGNIEEASAIAKNISQNEDKINFHGKRADAIVKSMLQHSRTSMGHMEFVDINALADEYLRLSYHGLRAKDKFFNATMQTYFDPTIGEIKIIHQDIGRVLLNLYNNSFYALSEEKKRRPEGYEPAISVSTKKHEAKIEIRVKDNGTGIPPIIMDKIFQPFFTTKPTGQGTGLGLSLSYDIVKAHGGEIKVETKEGEGSEFIIQLSII